jgi:hypothetical protein
MLSWHGPGSRRNRPPPGPGVTVAGMNVVPIKRSPRADRGPVSIWMVTAGGSATRETLFSVRSEKEAVALIGLLLTQTLRRPEPLRDAPQQRYHLRRILRRHL